MDPGTTYLGAEVEIGVDTVLEPSTMIMGKTKVGKACRIGPYTRIENCEIGDDVMIGRSAADRYRATAVASVSRSRQGSKPPPHAAIERALAPPATRAPAGGRPRVSAACGAAATT